jgi:ELWxxDGT repeat protein
MKTIPWLALGFALTTAACSSDSTAKEDPLPGNGNADAGATEPWNPPRANADAGDRGFNLAMVADINAAPSGTGTGAYLALGSRVFFGARSGAGFALFMLDGPATTPALVATRPTWRSAPQPEITSSGKLYFSVADELAGTELWVSDGTDGGTLLLLDGRIGSASGFARVFGEAFGGVVFAVSHGDVATMWRTSGTTATTAEISKVPVSTSRLSTTTAMIGSDRLLFASSRGDAGAELWSTDGTEAGTTLVRDINPGPASSSPTGFVAYQNKVLFFANDGTTGLEPWITDGTAAGTRLVRDLRPGANSGTNATATRPVVHDGFVYFAADDGATGLELWRSDGTTANTALVADLAPGPEASSPGAIVSLGARIVFSAQLAGSSGRELYASNGTLAGTTLLRDINPGTASSNIAAFVLLGSYAYFKADDGVHGNELWRTDGTQQGTSLVVDLVPGIGSGLFGGPRVSNDILFLDGGDLGAPHRSDGTAGGTKAVAPAGVATTAPSAPSAYVVAGDRVFFSATDGKHGRELWVSDGSAAGTRLVRDVNPGSRDGVTGPPYAADDRVYFVGTTPEHGAELWTSDGTEQGTRLVKDVRPGVSTGTIGPMAYFDGKLYFFADDGTAIGQELWSTDGTEQGTKLVADLDPTPNNIGYSPRNLGVYGGRLVFNARDTDYGVFALDPVSKKALVRIGPIGLLGDPIAAVGPEVYFGGARPLGAGGTDPPGLYRTNGTLAGTTLATTRQPCALAAVDGVAVFTNNNAIWRTDGTPAGTVAIAQVAPVCNYGRRGLFAFDGSIFFLGGNGTTGMGLWRTKPAPDTLERIHPLGVVDGTVPVLFEDRMFFSGGSAGTGFELWSSDGTAGGTRLVSDASAGTNSANPTELTVFKDALLLNLDDGVHGAEPWRLTR